MQRDYPSAYIPVPSLMGPMVRPSSITIFLRQSRQPMRIEVLNTSSTPGPNIRMANRLPVMTFTWRGLRSIRKNILIPIILFWSRLNQLHAGITRKSFG